MTVFRGGGYLLPAPTVLGVALDFSYEALFGQVHRNCKEVMGSANRCKTPTAPYGRTRATLACTNSRGKTKKVQN